MNPLIVLTLEHDIGAFETELQNGDDELSQHGCSVVEFCVLLQFAFDDGRVPLAEM